MYKHRYDGKEIAASLPAIQHLEHIVMHDIITCKWVPITIFTVINNKKYLPDDVWGFGKYAWIVGWYDDSWCD